MKDKSRTHAQNYSQLSFSQKGGTGYTRTKFNVVKHDNMEYENTITCHPRLT
jgi:hypothetical protein